MKKFQTVLLIIILVFKLIRPDAVLSASIALSRDGFVNTGFSGEISSDYLLVKNNGSKVQKYRISPSPLTPARLVMSSPSEFFLEPGKEQKIIVRFRQPLESFIGGLNIVAFESFDGSFSLASGVTVPVEYIVPKVLGEFDFFITEGKDRNIFFEHGKSALYVLFVLLLLPVIFFVLIKRNRAKEIKTRKSINFVQLL
jgi:hypothetical protein